MSRKQIINELNNSKDKKVINSEDVSDLDEETDVSDDDYDDNPNSSQAKSQQGAATQDMTNEFKEKVIAYLKCDDLIRKKMDEIKELKQQKKPCEEFILSFMENKDAPFVKVKGGKLIRNKSETKEGLKPETIRTAIVSSLLSEGLIKDDESKAIDLTQKIFNVADEKRGKTVRVNLKRTFTRGDNKN